MLIVLSPSKTIDFSNVSISQFSNTLFLEESSKLVDKITKFNTINLSELMKMSPKLSRQTFDKYQYWNPEHTSTNSKQALLAFKGEVYAGLDATTLSEKELLFAQNHLVILSGLYGILKPLDLIQPYRLEISTKLSIGNHNDLYSFWRSKITTGLNKVLSETSNNILINLASNEYFKSLDKSKLEIEIFTPVFKEYKNNYYKVISVYAKKARGLMARYIIKNQIYDVDELKLFNEDGYYFNNELSKGKELVFTRH